MPSKSIEQHWCERSPRPAAAPVALALTLFLTTPPRSRAEGELAVMHEAYREDDHRISVDTTSALIAGKLTESTLVRARYVYDAITGASPIGTPAPAKSREVPTMRLEDYRHAMNAEVVQQWGIHTLAPQFSYSIESDYESMGIAYTHTVEFNQKNTLLSVGASHDFDHVLDAKPKRETELKDTTDVMVGLSQLLGPTTVLSGNLIFGYSDGYLDDPYKRIAFDNYDPSGRAGFREQRPRYKSRGVALLALTQYVPWADASAELSYRAHADSFGISSHTVTATWNQKIGRHVIVSPFVRFYTQDEADFYYYRVPAALGDPILPGKDFPDYFSADYRLSAMETWTYGVALQFLLWDHVRLDFAYKRYEMKGTDGVTAQSAYPSANAFTAGLAITF